MYFYDKIFSKKEFEKSGIVLHFLNLFNVWLNRRRLDSHICAFNLLWYILVETFEENLVSHR